MGIRSLLRNLRHRPPLHPALQRNRSAFADFNQDIPLEDCEFAVTDMEMTGLDPAHDEIVAIGAVRIRGLSIITGDVFHTYVRPQRSMARPATLIHRITPAQLQHSPALAGLLPGFVDWCGQALITGHHVGLDMGFLTRACRRHLGGAPANPCVDTMRLAQAWERERWERSFDPFQPTVSYTLADLSARYGLPQFRAHDALEDALQTAYLFLYLVRKLKGGGITTLRGLHAAGRSWRWYL
ncbi:PolC-type DNA polymerase III [Oleidesulfovibrio alaskensis]|jgi:DNA polymerase-3 subunit epsilon|uniref:3'-5' exonuclease n=1 Tax=Oleidesulfovibrio alaskensis TaxID=58180 RepID=UPI001A62162A|nr:3'-5' exonuclease [Oleidesulfovibrio alaskensis]MBL3580824.1 3'-5' exonuclease [Oleidesulfovibrio alaskensis]